MVRIWAITDEIPVTQGNATVSAISSGRPLASDHFLAAAMAIASFLGARDGTQNHRAEPALLDELRGLWENWNREMLSLPEHLTPPMSDIGEMLR
jgi:hypothetical protein